MNDECVIHFFRRERAKLVNEIADLQTENLLLREAVERERNVCWQIARDFENWAFAEFVRVYQCRKVSDAIAVAPKKAV